MKSVVTQLLEAIPTAAEIKAFISENDADEKMLDNWIWEKVFKSNDWQAMERKQTIDAVANTVKLGTEKESVFLFTNKDEILVRQDAEEYYNKTFNK